MERICIKRELGLVAGKRNFHCLTVEVMINTNCVALPNLLGMVPTVGFAIYIHGCQSNLLVVIQLDFF